MLVPVPAPDNTVHFKVVLGFQEVNTFLRVPVPQVKMLLQFRPVMFKESIISDDAPFSDP